MNNTSWSSPLDHDGGLPGNIILSPNSETKSPNLEFDWSNENSSFDNAGLDILDYAAISECVDENLLADVDFAQKELSPLTPHAPAQLPPADLHFGHFEQPRASHLQPNASRELGLDFPQQEWNRQAFWKTVLSSSGAWSAFSASCNSTLAESHCGNTSNATEGRKRLKDEAWEDAGRPSTPHTASVPQVGIASPNPFDQRVSSEASPMNIMATLSKNQGNDQVPEAGSNENSETSAKVRTGAGQGLDRARPWACELCASRFSIKGHLSQHNRYVHEKYRPHTCPSCSASFGTRFARSQHIWTVHERKKPFVCEVPGCKASFGQRSHLNRHAKRHRVDAAREE